MRPYGKIHITSLRITSPAKEVCINSFDDLNAKARQIYLKLINFKMRMKPCKFLTPDL